LLYMRILIIRFSSLGDIVLTQPIIQRLYDVFPEAELFFITKEQYSAIPQLFGVPLKVVTYSDMLSAYSNLQQKQFDMVIDLQSKLNSFLIKHFCVRAKVFTYNKQRKLRVNIVEHKTQESIDSTLDLYQSALVKLALHMKQPLLADGLNNPKLFIQQPIMNKINSSLNKETGKIYIALFPGATHHTKMYPVPWFVQMIQNADRKYHFWLMGNEGEMWITSTVHQACKDNTTDLGGMFNVVELVDALASAEGVISNDSGPMHIAAALNKPQIAIFGSTHPRLGFRPLNDKAIILSSDIKCQPCSLHGTRVCPKKHFACMLSIEPDSVLKALNNLF